MMTTTPRTSKKKTWPVKKEGKRDVESDKKMMMKKKKKKKKKKNPSIHPNRERQDYRKKRK
jgi:hypothetical protein